MVDPPRITVHVPCEKGTVPYARYMWETMKSLANHPDRVRLLVHSIGPTAGLRLQGMPDTTWVETRSLRVGKDLAGSWGHACCIMQALKDACDGDLHVVCDSDTAVVARGWDDYVRNRILVGGLGFIGTTYEDVGGFSSGTAAVQTYKRVPTFTWAAFSARHDWPALDVLPDKDRKFVVSDEATSRVYNLPVGHSVFGEAGWQVPQFVADHGIPYDGWRHVKSTGEAVVLKGLSDYNEEYHAEGVPFVTHQRGSLRHAFREDGLSQRFYDRIDQWNAEERTRAPRWSWAGWQPALIVPPAHPSAYELALAKAYPSPTPGVPSQVTVGSPGANIDGWLKASLDGSVEWLKQTLPVPRTVHLAFDQRDSCRHLRLEGTVCQAGVSLPAIRTAPYLVALRNLTQGPVSVACVEGDRSVVVPVGACQMLVIDVDGVSQVT